MQRIRDVVGHDLQWVRPHWRRLDYELRDGTDVVATLAFRSAWGSMANAETGDGCWTFKRLGFLQTTATIRRCGGDEDLALFRNNTWTSGGTLELPDGRRYRAGSNFWMTGFEFTTEQGESLVRFRRIGGVVHLSASVQILPAALEVPELPWLVTLGWYVTVQMHRDAGAVAASAASA
jgi:hypothetical protein